jgi:hypothetical protein
MKTYIEYLSEISEDEVLKGLLAYGLFADKIPPVLSSESFYNYFVKKGKPMFEKQGKDYVRYESMRNVNIPRLLSVPNPFVYANLCNCISCNWNNLQSFFNELLATQTHKVSRIHLRKMKDKGQLFEMNYKHSDNDKDPCEDIMIKKRYKIEADISNCFPSIYSHSIAWAILGKKVAKEKKRTGEWCNELDCFVRNMKNGETNGILIGPHASNLISEIILLSIDCKLWKLEHRYIRNIDDYTCYVSSYEDAENFLLDLSKELKEYELSLNHKKTKITSLPIPSESSWINKLNNFYFGEEYTKEKKQVLKLKRLKTFLNLAIELALENNNTAILNYAIKVIASKYLGKDALDHYIKQIHHLLLLFPYLVHLMDEYIFNRFELDIDLIKQIGIDLYEIGINRRLYEACCFPIYWSIKYDYKFDKKSILEDAKASNDCLFLLLTFLRMKINKDADGIKQMKEIAKELSIAEFDRYWLFVYEALSESEISNEYKAIKKKKVSFIKSEVLAKF